MQRRELRQNCATSGREFNAYAAVIAGDRGFPDQLRSRRTIHQRHHCVVPFLQEFSEFGDRRPASTGETGDSEHQLVLLWRYAGNAGGFFAESQEQAESIPELAQLSDDNVVSHSGGWPIGRHP
jgi:hypothetical protein